MAEETPKKVSLLDRVKGFLNIGIIKTRLSDWRNRTYQKLVDKVVAYGIKKSYYKEKPPQKVIEKVPTYVYLDKIQYVTQTVYVNAQKKPEDELFDSTGGFLERPPFENLAPPVMQTYDVSRPEDITPVQLGVLNINVGAKFKDGSFQCTIAGTQFLSYDQGQYSLRLKLINWFENDPSLGYYGMAFSIRVIDGMIQACPHIDPSFDWNQIFPAGLEAAKLYPVPDGYYNFVKNPKTPSQEPIPVETPEEIEKRKAEIRKFLEVAKSWVNEAPPVAQTEKTIEDNKTGKINVIIFSKQGDESSDVFQCQVFGAYTDKENWTTPNIQNLEIKNFHKYIGLPGLDLDPYRMAFSIQVVDGVIQESLYTDSSKVNTTGLIPIPVDLSYEIPREDSILMYWESYLNT